VISVLAEYTPPHLLDMLDGLPDPQPISPHRKPYVRGSRHRRTRFVRWILRPRDAYGASE